MSSQRLKRLKNDHEHLVRALEGNDFIKVVETKCEFMKEIAFPDIVEAGLRVARLGNSSVTYEIGLFRKGDSDAAALGHFVHVYVDRDNRRPVRIPDDVRAALAPLQAKGVRLQPA